MYQNFSRKIGFGSKGYSLFLKELKSIKKVILISGSKSDYKNVLNKLNKIFKKKPKHIMLKKNRGNLDLINNIYAQNKNIDTIIALGGGSIIDFSKRLVFKFKNHKKIKFYILPTLLGSGAETSISSIINTPSEKNIVVNENFLPDGIVYDENLINSANKLSLLMGILDAFSHCIESLTSINKNYYLNFLSVETLNSFINKNSLNSLINKNKFNYFDLAILSFNGGIAQSNAGSGICHALTHSTEKILNINHSEGISFFIRPVLKYLLIKNKRDLKVLDKKLLRYISKLAQYTNKDDNLKRIKSLIYKETFIDNLIDKSKNDICWKLYNKNVDIKLLINFIKNENS